MSGNNLIIWGLAGVAGIILLAVLIQPFSVENYKHSQTLRKICWAECDNGWEPRPPGALALSPQQLTPWQYCQKKCVTLPLTQNSVMPGHTPPSCPKLRKGSAKRRRAVYNQNTGEWACTNAPINRFESPKSLRGREASGGPGEAR